MDESLELGFVGAGQMAQALASGMVRAGLVQPTQIWASDPAAGARQRFAELVPGCVVSADNRVVWDRPRILFLAVKPQHVAGLWSPPSSLLSIPAEVRDRHLFVSIVAGVPLSLLTQGLQSSRVVRVMPNTPCLVGQGASGFACAAGVGEAEQQLVGRLLQTVGLAYPLAEPLLDAVTGLSGSGPAYVFEFIEGLADGGVRMGLPRDVAMQLAAQTVLGAAQLMRDSGEHPAVLKDRVTSPGGTTIAGLHQLHVGGLRGTLINAVQAATLRSQELGRAAGSGSS